MIKTLIILFLLFLLFAFYFYPNETKDLIGNTGATVMDFSKKAGTTIVDNVLSIPEKLTDKSEG